MPKISSYPDGGAILASDQIVIARAGANYHIDGSQLFGGVNTETLLANKALADADAALQYLTPSGADRTVTLPAEASTNHAFFIYNNAAITSGLFLNVKDDGGNNIGYVVPASGKWFFSNGTAWKPSGGRSFIQGSAISFNPADSTTYYWGSGQGSQPNTGEFRNRIYVGTNCVIRSCRVFMMNLDGVASTAEQVDMYIRTNGATDNLIASVSNTSQAKTFTNNALEIALQYFHYFEFKLVCPAWATNPTNVLLSGTITLET